MAQTYTLEEAADKVNLSVEDFKRRLRTEWTHIRSFRDGNTLRFRANEIDELARMFGLGSSDELPLADSSSGGLEEYSAPAPTVEDSVPLLGGSAAADEDSSTPLLGGPANSPSATDDAPLQLDDSDEMFLLTPDKQASSVRLTGKDKGDSDVRLEKATPRPPAPGEDDESIITEEFEVPQAGGSGKLSGKSGKLSAAKLKSDSGKLKSGDSDKKAASKAMEDSSSEFELSLEPDSDEFELSLAPDSSEEVSLGEMPAAPAGASGPGGKAGQSGINLNRPADSGVSLEKKKPADDSDEIDFELSLDAPGSGKSAQRFASPSGKKLEADSDSEFELTLEEPSDLGMEADSDDDKKGDIFEATDFEIPALEDDSASEAVSLDEADTDLESSSDFDLALDESDIPAEDESASEVVALDEEAAPAKAKKKRKKVDEDDDDAAEVDLGDVELEEDEDGAAAALRGVRADDEEDEEAAPAGVAAPAKWGVLPVLLMTPTFLVLFLGGLMAYEMLHSVWGYQQSTKPTTPLVTFFAETFDLKPAQ